MPQVRDPKTGRYISGGGSSYESGASAGTNSRIQKAKAVGNGAPAGGSNPVEDTDAKRRRDLAKKYEDDEYVYYSDAIVPKKPEDSMQALKDLRDLAIHHAKTEKKGMGNIRHDAHAIALDKKNHLALMATPRTSKEYNQILKDIDKIVQGHLKISKRTGNY